MCFVHLSCNEQSFRIVNKGIDAIGAAFAPEIMAASGRTSSRISIRSSRSLSLCLCSFVCFLGILGVVFGYWVFGGVSV